SRTRSQLHRSEVRGKTRTKCRQQVRSACSALDCVLQNKQRGCRGHVAVTAQNLPRVAELGARKPQRILHRLQQFAAARVKQEAVEIVKRKPVAVEKIIKRRR